MAVVERGTQSEGAGARVRLGTRPARGMGGESLARALLRVALVTFLAAPVALGYLCTFSPLPFTYDGTGAFEIGPYLLGQPLRPYFMLLRPLGTLLLWGASGLLYLARAAVLPAWLQRRMTGAGARDGEPILALAAVSTRRTAALTLGLLAAVVLVRAAFIAFDLAFGPVHASALLAR